MSKALYIVVIALLLECIRAKYAYVTIHYEGTKRDDEYALAVRVWAKSLFAHGIKQDVVILVSENVRESTKQSFREIGCILKEIKNIENPYKKDADRRRSYKNHFEYTLNKLYVWNMLEYERVIYMDADNIFFHNIDNLFKCGHFCAVYMNPCNFHTGLFVVTPNNETYNDLLKSLATLPSYDGADQGFLVAYFDGLQRAPLFDPDHPFKEEEMPKMQRLSIGYNNNHIFHYVEGAMDQFRVFGLKDSSEPFYSLTYAIAPILKPWYWWGYPILDMHWYWNQQRSLLNDNWAPSFSVRAVLMIVGVMINTLIVKRIAYARKNNSSSCQLVQKLKGHWFVWNIISCTLGVLVLLFSLNTLTYVVPVLMPAHLALVLSVLYIFCCQWMAACYIKLFRPFSSSMVRSIGLPRYWYWCVIYCLFMYFGVTYYMDCYTKILAAFTFIYYVIKVTAYESIKVYRERTEIVN